MKESVRVRLILLAACLIVLGSCTTPALAGSDLGRRPAPEFTLVDGPTGETVSLSARRGSVVILADPDGYVWEVAHNPSWTLAEDGSVRLG